VDDEGFVPQGQPQVLPATRRAADGLAAKAVREVPRPTGVPAHGSGMKHLDICHRAPGNPSLKSGANDLDLGQLRHR